MSTNASLLDPLEIPFKDFMPGQIIQSVHFNDDMGDIEDKINEIVVNHNLITGEVDEHTSDVSNPHSVTAHQTGTYESEEIDEFVADIKSGNLNNESITNRVLADDCVSEDKILDGSVTVGKIAQGVGNVLDISNNITIKGIYTKEETDTLIQEKVGSGTYDKSTLDEKFEQIQAGQILDKSITVDQLKDNVGALLNISSNPSISDKYTKREVDLLIKENGLPKDWGSVTDDVNVVGVDILSTLPMAGYMTCGEFRTNETNVLDVNIKEVIDSRGSYSTLNARLKHIEDILSELLEK